MVVYMKVKSLSKKLKSIIFLLLLLVLFSFVQKELSKSSYASVSKNDNIVNGNLEIYYFDVGEADSILIKENDYTMLIDAGNNEDGENLVNYLKDDIGISNINIVVGTHPHEDHIGGLDNIINSFDIEKIYLPNVITTSKTFKDVLNAIEDRHYKITIPKVDESIILGDLRFKVLNTGTDEKNLNDSSIVLRLDYGSTSYLFTADISSQIEKELLNSDIDVDVLKISHHGSGYSSSIDFLKSVSPKYAIISVGKDNTYNHPSSKVIKRLNDMNVEVYRTDDSGTIKIVSDGNSIKTDSFNTEIDG